MHHQTIIDLSGYSEFSPEIKQLFIKLDIPPERPEELICRRTYVSKTWDVTLVFKGKNNYLYDYGPVCKAYSDSADESFLEEINFGSYKGNIKYPFSLPYHFSFSDTPGNIIKKAGIKPTESSDAVYGSYLLFNTADYQILTGFDKAHKLIWVRVRPLELAFKKKRALTKHLKEQNKNISPVHSQLLMELKMKSPATEWRARMTAGDSNFKDAGITGTEFILHGFIDSIISYSEQKKAAAIYSSVRKAVLSINKLNEKFHHFIETDGREALVAYIHQAVRLTGFKIDDGLDLTEEWRAW